MIDLKDDPRLTQWFELSEYSESTRMNYTIYMQQFCNCVGLTPSQLIEEAIKETKQGLLLSERQTLTYITKYKQWLTKNDYAPKTEGLALAAIRSFYKNHDIQLSSRLGKLKKRMPLRENQNFLTRDDVKKLIVNAKNLRDKAIMLCMVSSGMAQNEIINLKLRDITFDKNNIGTISIRREKAQVDYVTFISPEATQALRNYFEERSRSPELRVKGDSDYIFVTYESGRTGGDRGGKISEATFMKNFRDLGVELGYKNGKGLLTKSRSHALRKFFASILENAGMPKNKIDFMLGHTPNSNDLAYFQTNPEKLKQLYIKYLPYLTFEKTIEVRSLDSKDAERLAALETENEKLKAMLNEDAIDAMIKKRMEEILKQKGE